MRYRNRANTHWLPFKKTHLKVSYVDGRYSGQGGKSYNSDIFGNMQFIWRKDTSAET